MSSWKYKRLFLIMYFILGSIWFLFYLQINFISNVSLSSISDIVYVIYWYLPFIFAIFAMLSFIFRKAVEVVLWCCTLFWMFLSLGELLEGGGIKPGILPVLFASILSCICAGYLIYTKYRNLGRRHFK